jgi:uncharacterized protein YjiS (DUF1127 family)
MNASANFRDIELEKLEGRSLFAAADPVLLWNAVALDAVADDYAVGVDPEQRAQRQRRRALAIVHAAIYDAVTRVRPRIRTVPRFRQGAWQQRHRERARLFAMLNLTMADAGIASWDTEVRVRLLATDPRHPDAQCRRQLDG